MKVTHVQIEHLKETLGIGVARPRLSWRVETASENWQQSAYEIAVDAQTHKVESDQSLLVAWPFAPFHSRQRVGVQVRVWGTDGTQSDWSDVVWIETGLLDANDWHAQFVTPTWDEDPNSDNPSPYLRRDFALRDEIETARLYITALGVYEAQINGQRVGDHEFAPGWTVYDERLRYQTFDVTNLLQAGANAIGAIVADGWYRGRLGFEGGRRNIYGDRLALLAQLEVTYADGTTERIVTDENWQAATGAILASSIYDGESYDARLEMAGWSQRGFDARDWSAVRVLEQDVSILEAPISPPVRRTEEIAPVSITQSPSGKTLVDFGQNLVGRCRITVQGEAGHFVTLRHAEVLEGGELGVRPLRTAAATDRYTLRGNGVESYEPRFTFHGFRYVEVDNWPSQLQSSDIAAIVLHSDMERTGDFECSDPLLNQLHQNVVWGMRGNFLDVPTDCPQRDERLGWTGDIQVFTPTAAFLYDVSGFLQSWLRDLAIEQTKSNGSVPHVVPNILGDGGAAAWGDAATVVPWVLYERYGDTQILADQFESMCAWVDFVAEKAGENYLWDTGFQFGDWLDPTAPPNSPWQARTDKVIVASAYFARSAEITAQTAAILNNPTAHEKYATLAHNAKTAFANEYLTPNGRMMNDAETAYALAIAFDLTHNDTQRQRAGDRLAELVREGGYTIRTGFVGTPLICDALCGTGHHAIAYRLLKQQQSPSWLYPVTMGATTIWERWDSMLPDGSINPGEMTSFNHYALGAVADWMQRTIGGLAPANAGYQTIRFAPRPGGNITRCTTRLQTPYGMTECSWHIDGDTFEMTVTVPPSACGVVRLPGQDDETSVGSGTHRYTILYSDPDARGAFTVDDYIGDILYEPDGQRIIMETLDKLNAPGFLRFVIPNNRGTRLRDGLGAISDKAEAVRMFNEALAVLETI